jgi:hypothetical protein
MNLQLEAGEADRPTRCECCGRVSRTVHGFIYKDGDAYAVYYAGWSEGHPDRGVTMAVAVGEWDDNSDASDRVSVGLEAWSAVSKIQFAVLEPEQSPWANTDLLGAMLARPTALAHPVLPAIFEVAEHVVTCDERVASFLNRISVEGD